jgi:PAS domain S-box-containing protein
LLARVALDHQLHGVYVFDSLGQPISGGIVRGPRTSPPDFVLEEMQDLLGNPEAKFLLLLDPGQTPSEAIHYYLELTNDLDRVILVVADALYYVNALQQTQIGYLAQKMSREPGVEYIVYQSTEGIVFSSRRISELLTIDADSFLTRALESDTIVQRIISVDRRNVLELARPFSTPDYQFGLLRIGLSLEAYYSVSRAFDRQMIALAIVLFFLVVAVVLYLNSRRKRHEIDRQYRQIKSITDKIFEEMRTGVAVVDEAGNLTLANEAFERIFRLRAPVGRPWNALISHPALNFESVVDNRLGDEIEVELTTGKEKQTILVAMSHLGERSGEAGGTVIVVYDITRLKEFEQKSARKERLSELGDLAAGVAHEIRNPLNTISIAAQRLAAEFTPTENESGFKSFTTQIREETRRLNTIITRFLALARDEQRHEKVIDLKSFLSDAVSLLEIEAEQVGIVIELTCEDSLKIKADEDALKQVFTNLFANAREALKEEKGKINISCQRADDTAEIRFADSGPGIEPHIAERIFAPYFTTKEGGTGLGLPTVHRIVTAMGGEVTCEPAERGAIFVITLPLTS